MLNKFVIVQKTETPKFYLWICHKQEDFLVYVLYKKYAIYFYLKQNQLMGH